MWIPDMWSVVVDRTGIGAHRAAVCSPLWSTNTGSRITGAPAVSLGHLYVGTEDGRLIAYRPVEAD